MVGTGVWGATMSGPRLREHLGASSRLREPSTWLGAAIFVLGASAALAGGSGVAHADSADANSSTVAPHQSEASEPTAAHRTGPAAARPTVRRLSAPERPTHRGLVVRSRDIEHAADEEVSESSPAAATAPRGTKSRLEAKNRLAVAGRSVVADPDGDEISQRIAAQSIAFTEQHTMLTAQRKAFAADVKEAIGDWTPPEINSSRVPAGVGSEALLSAAAAWNGLATDLNSVASSFDRVADNLGGHTRAGSVVSTAVESYAGWLATSASRAEHASAQASAAAAAYESAFSAGVPPPALSMNRATLASLIAVNFLSLNVPAIVATDVMYLEMLAGRVPMTQPSTPH